jgi:hypothetical protein
MRIILEILQILNNKFPIINKLYWKIKIKDILIILQIKIITMIILKLKIISKRLNYKLISEILEILQIMKKHQIINNN